MSEDKRRLTVREICEISGMSKAWIGWKCREGDFPGAEKHRENGRLEWTVPEGELKNYMEDRRLGLKPRKRRKEDRSPALSRAQALVSSSAKPNDLE
jgi:predicted DNA-binding transcriptional regulator AlpA